MLRKILCSCILLSTTLAYSQTSFSAVTINAVAVAGNDSADFFLQKGLLEKQNGRRLESLKNFERAATYDGRSKVITAELASAYLDLRRYSQARDFQKISGIGR
jgi:tetratricopeptide (TPR) repeat protein